MILSMIVFVASHAGPAKHFDAFAEELKEQDIQIWASPPAQTNLKKHKIIPLHQMDASKAKEIALACQEAACVITDVGHPFSINVQQAFKEHAPKVKRFAYYDNFEATVPGEYNSIADKVMALANLALFANPEIAPKEAKGIGYYPVDDEITQYNKEEKRTEFFDELSREETGQRICVFLGGNNEQFYEEAFPTFCRIVPNDQNWLFVFQPHPSGKRVELPKHVLLSHWKSADILKIADRVLYHQITMAPQIALSRIPIIQVAKTMCEDPLMRSGFPFVSKQRELKAALELDWEERCLSPESVGYSDDWPKRLRDALQTSFD